MSERSVSTEAILSTEAERQARAAVAKTRESLDLIGDGDWTPQDHHAANLAVILEHFVMSHEALRAERDGYLKRLDECVVRAQWNEVRAIEAEAEVKTLREALGEDLAGRPFADLLTEAAAVMRGMGGGPLADCLAAKAEDVRAALAADTPEAT